MPSLFQRIAMTWGQPLFIRSLCCKTSIQDTFRRIFRREPLPARSPFPPAYREKVENPHEPVYLAGVSVRRAEDVTEVLWNSKVSPATISGLNKKAYAAY